VSGGADRASERGGGPAPPLTTRLAETWGRVSSRPAIWYSAATVALIFVWDGRFLLTQKIGIWDWDKESYGLEFLKSAMRHGSLLPLSFLTIPHDIATYPALFQSTSYWANPEVLTFSPFVAFLPFVSVPVFFKLYFLGHLLIAAAGMYLLGRRLGLRTIAAVVLFVLLVLNPWLLQHLAIGYTPWITICWVPLVVASLLRPLTLAWFVAGTVADSLILYEGGLHVFLWLNATIVLVALALAALRRSVAHARPVALILVGTAILTLPKLVAIHAAYGNWLRPIQSSYAGAHDLWGLLTDTTTNLYELPRAYHVYGTDVYDGAMFTGRLFLATLLLLVALLAWRTIKGPRDTSVAVGWALLAVAALWLVLGWDGVWRGLAGWISALHFEIYPFRFLEISVFICAAFIVLELDRLSRLDIRLGVVGLAVALVVSLTFLHRNDYFAKFATSMPYAPPVWHPERFLDDTLTAKSTDPRSARPVVAHSLKVVSIEPLGSKADLRLDWLPGEHVHDFAIDNAHVVEQDGLGSTIAVGDAYSPVVIKPRAYHRGLLFLVSAVLYGLLLGALRARERATRPLSEATSRHGSASSRRRAPDDGEPGCDEVSVSSQLLEP
jgi:hypothetical protein